MLTQPKSWVLVLLILLGCTNSSYASLTSVDPKVLHIINRLSFGPRPGEIQRVESIGVEHYIQEQLSPDSLSEPANLTSQLSQLETYNMTPEQLAQYASLGPNPTPEARNAAGKVANHILDQAIQARLLRATTSPRQLQEVMVEFWYNHFNVDADKGKDRLWVGSYEQEAIRPYTLGRFRDLLGATAHHPAMLYYLDNYQNRIVGRPDGSGKYTGLNENYARELMELHTLGVDGGYTQQDVITLARIFSGWGIGQVTSDFEFNPKHHDFSDKVFLGHKIKGSGEAEGEQALDILARSPATAHHISYQLAQYFVSDRPPATLVNRLTQRYLVTDGNIREVLIALFHSPEFWDQKSYQAKFKTPYQYAISSVRLTGMAVNNTQPITNILQQLAMPLYHCQTPDGYKNTEDVWLNPDAMTRRLSFATALANGNLPLLQLPEIKPKPLDPGHLSNALGNSLSTKTQQAIASAPPQIRSALILGSPEFMWR